MRGPIMGIVGATRRKSWLPILTVFLGLGIVNSALAQQPSQAQQNAVRSACRSDYMAHCSSVPTGGKQALDCLRQNIASLSSACQKAVNAIGGGPAAQPPAAAPAQPATPQPAPAVAAPPAVSAPAAPPAAAAAPPAPVRYPPLSPRQEFAIVRFSCGPDYQAMCGGVPFGGGRVASCLRANAPSLSPRCRRALMGALAR